MSDVLAFLAALFAPCEQGFVTLTAIHPDRQHPTPSRHVLVSKPDQLAHNLNDLTLANRAGWGAFVGIALRRSDLGRWRRGGWPDLLSLPALFVDVDRDGSETLAQLRNIRPPPSAIIHSGGGYHAYFYLSQPTKELAYAQLILNNLARATGGDTLTVAQSMRLVSSQNHKPQRLGAMCRLLEHHPDRRYTLDQLAAITGPSPLHTPQIIPRSPPHRFPVQKDLNPALIARVTQVLCQDYGGFERSDGWLGSLCPARHRRDYPGSHFYFNPARAVGHCFGRHGRLLLRDLCPLLGIDSAAYGGIYQRLDK